jgi:hypothetical protein
MLLRNALPLIALLATVSCGVRPVPGEPGFSRLEDVLGWRGELRLEGEAVEALPTVAVTPAGDLVVAELGDREIRKHDGRGRLCISLHASGTESLDPLAFALWVPGDSLVGYSALGAFAFFDPAGALVRVGKTGLVPLYAGRIVDDSTVLLAGRVPGVPETSLLHLWDLRRQRVVRSFFRVPSHDPRLASAYSFSGATAMDVHGDTVAATFARADTVYLFDLAGRALEKLPIPFVNFRMLSEPPPDRRDPAEMIRWRESYSTVSQVFWAPDGTLFIQYFNMTGFEPRWGLLHMSRTGRRIFDAADPGCLRYSRTAGCCLWDPRERVAGGG